MQQNNTPLSFSVGKEKFNMIKVEGGTFMMGADNGVIKKGRWPFRSKKVNPNVPNFDPMASDREKPVHQVTLSDFYMAERCVSIGLWGALMGKTGDSFVEMEEVVNVDWHMCKHFIKRLNEATGATFRLPTEAEWEYAARGGRLSHGYRYAGSNNVDEVAYYSKNIPDSENEIPNELGLFQMSGYLYEWCEDCGYDYESSPQVNPCHVDANAKDHILRGGCYVHDAEACRVTARSGCYTPFGKDDLFDYIGFRLALS